MLPQFLQRALARDSHDATRETRMQGRQDDGRPAVAVAASHWLSVSDLSN